MKFPKITRPKKKLRATTSRRSLAAADEMDFEEMSEPNMKLSRALLIVLVLHVVAVAGIIAFNAIKSRQGAFPPPVTTAAPAKVQPTETAEAAPLKAEPVATPTVNLTTAQKAAAVVPKAGSEPSVIPRAQPVATTANGNVYTVAKGDNPVKIAKKLKVSETELLSLNGIDDPRKLQIGQKLLVPTKSKTKKSAD
jgi:LysM repeat protein